MGGKEQEQERACSESELDGSMVVVCMTAKGALALPLTEHLQHFGWREQRTRAAKLLQTARVRGADAEAHRRSGQ